MNIIDKVYDSIRVYIQKNGTQLSGLGYLCLKNPWRKNDTEDETIDSLPFGFYDPPFVPETKLLDYAIGDENTNEGKVFISQYYEFINFPIRDNDQNIIEPRDLDWIEAESTECREPSLDVAQGKLDCKTPGIPGILIFSKNPKLWTQPKIPFPIVSCGCYKIFRKFNEDEKLNLMKKVYANLHDEFKAFWYDQVINLFKERFDSISPFFMDKNKRDKLRTIIFYYITNVPDAFNFDDINDYFTGLKIIISQEAELSELNKQEILQIFNINTVSEKITPKVFEIAKIWEFSLAIILNLDMVEPIKCNINKTIQNILHPTSLEPSDLTGPLDSKLKDKHVREEILEHLNKEYFDGALLTKGDAIETRITKQEKCDLIDTYWVRKNNLLGDLSWKSLREFLVNIKSAVWPELNEFCECKDCPENYVFCNVSEKCIPKCCGAMSVIDGSVTSLKQDCMCDCPEGYMWVECLGSNCDKRNISCEEESKGFCVAYPDYPERVDWDGTNCKWVCKTEFHHHTQTEQKNKLSYDTVLWLANQNPSEILIPDSTGQIVNTNTMSSFDLLDKINEWNNSNEKLLSLRLVCTNVSGYRDPDYECNCSAENYENMGAPKLPEGFVLLNKNVVSITEQ